MSKVKIINLEIENTKRVKAVRLTPTQNGLTTLAGDNNQGKTSVLDAIAWNLGGNKFKPSQPQREGSATPPFSRVELSNGLIVERGGKNSDLKVIDPTGNRAGQKLLDSFISELALDIPKFLQQSSKEKAKTLLNVIGVGDQLYHMDKAEEKIYSERTAIGNIQKQKENYAKELIQYDNVPEMPVSAKELINQQQAILMTNAENEKKRNNLLKLKEKEESLKLQLANENKQLEEIMNKIKNTKALIETNDDDLITAQKTVEQLQDESTQDLEDSINNIEAINNKVRANLDRERAIDEAESYKTQYDNLTKEIQKVRDDKMALLKGADLPLEGLSVENEELTYQGFNWDNMSGSQQLKVATAIVRKLNPDCGFVLLDKLEQFDSTQLQEFGQWLEQEELQAIGTRVGKSGTDSEIIIEDGYILGQENITFEDEKEKTVAIPISW